MGGFPPLLTAGVARELLGGALHVSLDLGLSEVGVEHVEGGVLLPDGHLVGRGDLERVADQEGAVFFPRDGILLQVAMAGDHFFKLLPTEGAPTIEIDGVRMHRTRRTTPDADAGLKLEALGVGGCRVLDTCAGLGYTALGAVGRGAELAVSVELELYQSERDRLVRVCMAALHAGVGERQVKLAEWQAERLAEVVSAIVTDLGHDLEDEKVRNVVRLRLTEDGEEAGTRAHGYPA